MSTSDPSRTTTRELVVPSRFRGPAPSGNGGWTAGAVADLLTADPSGTPRQAWPAVQVSLRLPPPLESAMAVTGDDRAVQAVHDGAAVADAEVTGADPVPVEPVTPSEARAAEASYPGLAFHPFPTCFSCGTGREPGDGMRIFPGQVPDAVPGRTRVAATWTPHPSLADPSGTHDDRTSLAVAWAALDCVGGWASDLTDRLMVLGRMTAVIDALPVLGEEHVIVGEARGAEGRKVYAGTTAYDSDGRIVGRAEQVWITVDAAAFN